MKKLSGKRILITRAKEQSKNFSDAIIKMGGIPYQFSTIEITQPDDIKPLDDAIDSLQCYDYIVFTSINSVIKFMERLKFKGFDGSILKRIKLAAVGEKTKEKLEEFNLKVDVTGREFKSEGLLEALLKEGIKSKKILMPRAQEAREILPEGLRKAGGVVDVVPAYRNIPASSGSTKEIEKLFREKKIDAVTFTSSSTVQNFANAFKKTNIKKLLKGIPVFAIGSVTAETARKFGIEKVYIPDKFTTNDLLEKIADYFSAGKIPVHKDDKALQR